MKNDVLNSFVFERLLLIEQQLYAFRKDHKAERLHRLRVDMKKIKSVLRFVNYTFKTDKDLKRVRPLFRQAGKIRDIQLILESLKNASVPKEQLIKLMKKEVKLTQTFTKKNDIHRKSLKTFRQKTKLPLHPPSDKKIRKYFVLKLKEATEMLPTQDRETMHHFRMVIKELMYVHSALPVDLQEISRLNKAFVDHLQELAGDWHDVYMIKEYLLKTPQSAPIKKQFLLVKKQETKQFNALHAFWEKYKGEIIN